LASISTLRAAPADATTPNASWVVTELPHAGRYPTVPPRNADRADREWEE
jgi:hypothetical protein